MESDESLQGSLTDFPLMVLLKSLASKNRTGVLRIEDGSEIWFDSGKVYLATTATSAPIASILYGADVGSKDLIESMLGDPNNSLPVIDQLVYSHREREQILSRLLHESNLNCLFELLVPSEAWFGFEAGPIHPIGSRFAESTEELVAQAEQRLDIWRRIAARIPSTSVKFCLAPALPNEATDRIISAEEWRYLALLDGATSVSDVINHTGESAFRVTSSLYRLLLEDLIVEKTGQV